MSEPKTTYQTKNLQKSQVISLEKGKIPPQAIDLEEVVIGAAIIDKTAIAEVVEILGQIPEVFYKDQHRHIYEAMLQMYDESESIDILTLCQKLKTRNKLELIGGEFYLISLTQRVSSSAHIERHCRIIMQMYVKRQSIKVASEIIENAYEDATDIFDLLEDSQRSLDDTAQWLFRKKPTDIKTAYSQYLQQSATNEIGIPSKLSKLNKKTGGYHAGDLVIVAGRPGMGKTAFVLNEAKHQAKQNIPVGIFSLEMVTRQLLGRFISEEFGIESSRIKYNNLTISERQIVEKESARIADLPIQIHDEGSLTVIEAKTIIGSWVRQFGVKIVYIDYLQLMNGSGNGKSGNREQEISYISRSLKAIAKEFSVCIVALSQLSRAVETRGGIKRPILSDLRESGAIEQDADVVYFIYRPEYYKIDIWDYDDAGSTYNQCEINIAKIREGETGATIVGCNLKYMRFEDLEQSNWQPIDNQSNQDIKPESPVNAFETPSIDQISNFDDDDDFPF